MDYNSESNKIQCARCPQGYYSSNSTFISGGNINRLNQNPLAQFSNDCYLVGFNSSSRNRNCTNWILEADGTTLRSGIGILNTRYFAEFKFNLLLENKGSVIPLFTIY